jgi:hypothetical protein
MKKIKILTIGAILILMINSQSCKKTLEGVNDNPNEPSDVTPRVLLPGAEGSLAYTQGGDVERIISVFVQYVTGVSRQFQAYQQYSFTEEDFNNVWNNLYAATMENFKVIMDKDNAEPGSYQTYGGIARILMAYTLGMTTDCWGDVPYNEAFQGNANLTPAYQPQEAIYDTIQSLLTQGINELSNNPGDDVDVPGGDDFIFGGDVDAWISLAHALKARYYIHLTKVDNNNGLTAAQMALDEINAGGGMITATYPFSSTGPNPWFQWIEQRDDIAYEGTALTLMQSRNDPRYDVYIDTDGSFWGEGYLGEFFAAESSPVILMADFELKFIEAEAKFRLGDVAGAQVAFTEAIQASFDFYGVTDTTDYIGSYGTLNSGTELEQIITEKWLANFLHPESWTDWRRTDYPELTPNAGSAIPRRFIYPTNERLYNPNSINQNSDLYQPRLWWDQP